MRLLLEPEGFRQISDKLYSGGSIDKPENIDYLKSIGIKTVINLSHGSHRANYNEEDLRLDVEQRNIRYISRPFWGRFLIHRKFLKEIMSYIVDPNNAKVYLHCDKHTSIIVALYRIETEGKDREEVWKEEECHGLRWNYDHYLEE
jgi:protein tyrosine phosphatase (PTP) superfamily phosphohydrolase (DUF442 family)